MSTPPIKPSDIRVVASVPDEMIEAVNNLILTKWDRKESTFQQRELIAEFHRITQHRHIDEQIFDGKWMDFEALFEQEGWVVEYDKPAYNESYEPSFTFKVRK